MMRKIYLSFLFVTLCLIGAIANPVTKEQAQLKAKAFLQARGLSAGAGMQLVYQGRQASHQNGAPAKDACYYVFNNGHDGGFVIVAGDDCAENILGYADSGTFDADNIPENMQTFLQGLANQIGAARAQGLTATGDVENVEVARKVVAPLITTHWNQRDPYNQKCFKPDGTTQCVTGCVATALAQVMYYYKWPTKATTVIPAYTSIYGDSYGELPTITFDWSKMKPVYINTGDDDQDAETAVAQLLLYCGHAVKMNYSSGSSGASPSYIPNALKNYFGYPGNPSYVTRSQFGALEWDELIYNELKHGRPVLYGASTSGGSGHEFILDGYDGHSLYHVNWGWGGLSDGYFRLQALRPSSQGTGGSSDNGGYSLNHDAVIGVSSSVATDEGSGSGEADEDGSYLTTVSLTVSGDNPFSYSSSYGFNKPSVSFSFTLSGSNKVLDIGVGLYQDGVLLQDKVIYSGQQLSSGSVYTSSGSLFYGLGTGLADGVYQVKGINRVNGTENWFENEGSDRIYVELTISNGQVTYTNVSKEPAKGLLKITSVEQRFDTEKGQIRAYVENIGETDYYGSLHLFIGENWMAEEGVYIGVDGRDYVDFFFNPLTGDVKVEIATDYNASDVIYTNENFTLAESGSDLPSLTKVGEVEIKNISDNKMYGALLDGSVVLKNETGSDFEDNLSLKLDVYSESDGYYYYFDVRTQLIPVSIKDGETKTIPISNSCLAIGDKFKYTLTAPDGSVLASKSSFIEVVPGVVYWKGTGERYAVAPTDKIIVPGDVAAVSFEDLDMSKYNVTLNDNITTIYYLAYNDQAGFQKINAANVVMGGEAQNIMLREDYDFFVPKAFHVSGTISYSRLPEIGADGKNGWQTITLPFAVQKVTSGNNEVDWYHGNDTEEKDFWVREFKQVAGNVVQFADVAEWIPNIPYIIAVPGNHWGEQYDMTYKILEFSATDARVERTTVSAAVSDNYEFVGVTGNTTIDGEVYVLNEKGSLFVKKDGATLNGCSAYFTINNPSVNTPNSLNIGFFDTTGICLPRVTADDGQMVDVYAVDGAKVAAVSVHGGKADLSRLPKGIYIVEGKKIVR